MITYSLVCDSEHKFDAWFRNAEAYHLQAEAGLLSCPVCASVVVGKALMAPAVAKSSIEAVPVAAGHPRQAELLAEMRRLRAELTRDADYVGDRFAEEARRIHFKEAEARGIYGEATRDEVTSLAEDGIDFLPLPALPEERN